MRKYGRITVLLLTVAMVMSMSFTVMADEPELLYELNLEDYNEGKTPKEAYNPSDKGLVTVKVDETGEKYISVEDRDLSALVGWSAPSVPKGDVITISMDYRNRSGSNGSGQLYVIGRTGYNICLTLSGAPSQYDGTQNISTAGTMLPDEWSNVTVIARTTENNFDLYQDGMLIGENLPYRGGSFLDRAQINMWGPQSSVSLFDFKNLKMYNGEVIPKRADKLDDIITNPERQLVDYGDAPERLEKTLKNAVAMTVGNSIARAYNSYVPIDSANEYVAPFVTADGYTLIPVRFTTEAIGCSVEVVSSTKFRFSKDGTVMEINMGDKNAVINGEVREMPTTPVIKYDRLFIPLRFAAETFGKNVFWDDRGLIVISDGEVVKAGQEEIIKPLISDIRHRTSILGNKKYSDVNYSSRGFNTDGFAGGQWGTLDAAKRFMATVNRWTYDIKGDTNKAQRDQGLLIQGTLNANWRDTTDYEQSTYFLDGTPYTRADGANGTTWACANDPTYYEHLLGRAKSGLDNGLFNWQFDDWAMNTNYRYGYCFCDRCITGFAGFLSENPERAAAAGVTDPASFNYKEYVKAQGVTKPETYAQMNGTPIHDLWYEFHEKSVHKFLRSLVADMEEYFGSEIFFSVNAANMAEYGGTKLNDIVDAVMGESGGELSKADSLFANMYATRSMGMENILSPLPNGKDATDLMYSAIPMCYATGQFVLVPWDAWLFGATRYYATLEELGGLYELPREYPFLFDNYEIPERYGFIYDLDAGGNFKDYAHKLGKAGAPVRGIIRKDGNATFDENDLKGLQTVVAATSLDGLTDAEKAAIANSGVQVLESSDYEQTIWTARNISGDDKIYTVLRENRLYDNAPVVVHVVNYNTTPRTNVEIEVNNIYLPEGDTLTINVYKPGENKSQITVPKGNGATKITVDSINKWTVLEICGANTVRREVKFDLKEFGGIGMGTRISNDKAYGTDDDFTIVTYGEGMNSATFGDTTGVQDEMAFVYKRLSKGALRKAVITAGFDNPDGAYGVTVRDGIYSNASFVALVYDKENGLRLASRKYANKAVRYKKLGDEAPAFMKLQRDGGVWYAYISDDNVNFTEVASIEFAFDTPVGGVIAASPDGSRAECRVKKLIVSDGNYPAEDFEKFVIRYKKGTIRSVDTDEKMEIILQTKSYDNITADDVEITFVSSDDNVIKVRDDGSLVPLNGGTATITATAKMGLKKISASTTIKVTEPPAQMFAENFDELTGVPDYIARASKGVQDVKDGAFRVMSEVTGEESDVVFNFEQYNKTTVFEFDFRATFGKESPTTGARVLYANTSNAISFTCDPNGFNWFFGENQTHIADIEEGKWYHIKIIVNYEEQYGDVYIDGEQVVNHGQFRRLASPDGTIQLGAWRVGTDSSFEWDNINIYFVK